jgi:hypothetical protein
MINCSYASAEDTCQLNLSERVRPECKTCVANDQHKATAATAPKAFKSPANTHDNTCKSCVEKDEKITLLKNAIAELNNQLSKFTNQWKKARKQKKETLELIKHKARIIQLIDEDGHSQRAVARLFDTSPTQIARLLKGLLEKSREK